MPSALEAVLRNYLETHWKRNEAGLLFPNCKGTKPLNRVNVKYATELANASVPLPVLQRRMRHADLHTTLRIYSHLVSDTHVDVMEKLAQRSIGTNCPIGTKVKA